MAWITDSLRSAIARINPFSQGAAHQGLGAGMFTHQLAIAAYLASGMMRKVIMIPAADRTQKWRDWQAKKEIIALIELEEKRHNLLAKTKQCEILRGIGGGAMILITTGNHAEELRPETIAKGGLVAVNVVTRWEITGKDWVRNMADPLFREPRMFQINSEDGQQDIHPSRVICFRGDPLPTGGAVSDEEAFWGDSRLIRVFNEVQRSDSTQEWFAALVKKAKLLRIGIPNLTDFTATTEGKAKLDSRVALIAEGENSLNAVVYDSGDGREGGNPGEKIDDYQITWAGIPAVSDMFDQRVAAVSDIPFTRLMGRSPAGMNSTGQHDTDNWHDAVSDGQESETRPCLEKLDPFLLRSAGVPEPDKVWWTWAPLDTPTEKEKAETFKILVEAIEKLLMTGMVPEKALAQAVQNLLEERGDLPGLAEALAKISESERYGGAPDDDGTDEDPSELRTKPKGGDQSSGAEGA